MRAARRLEEGLAGPVYFRRSSGGVLGADFARQHIGEHAAGVVVLHRLGAWRIVDHDRRDALAWNIGQFLARDLPHVVGRPAAGSDHQSSRRKKSGGSQGTAGFMKENFILLSWISPCPSHWVGSSPLLPRPDELSAGPWPYAFQHLMRHTRIGKRPDGSDVHGQIARGDHCCNPCQMRGGDINEKERPKTRSWWKRASCRQRWCRIGKSPHAVCISSTRSASATTQYAPAASEILAGGMRGHAEPLSVTPC